jgi:hypothetical protein
MLFSDICHIHIHTSFTYRTIVNSFIIIHTNRRILPRVNTKYSHPHYHYHSSSSMLAVACSGRSGGHRILWLQKIWRARWIGHAYTGSSRSTLDGQALSRGDTADRPQSTYRLLLAALPVENYVGISTSLLSRGPRVLRICLHNRQSAPIPFKRKHHQDGRRR